MSEEEIEILRDKFLKYHLEYKDEEMLFEIIDKLQKENEEYKTASNFSKAQLEYIKKYYVDKDKIRECIDTKTNIVINDKFNSKDVIQIAVDKGIEELLKMIKQELLGE